MYRQKILTKQIQLLFIFSLLSIHLYAQSPSLRIDKHVLSLDTVFYGEKTKVEHFTIYNITDKTVELRVSGRNHEVFFQYDDHYQNGFIDAHDSVKVSVFMFSCKSNIFPIKVMLGSFRDKPNLMDTVTINGIFYKKNGLYLKYWENGKLKSRIHYNNGEYDGEFTEWYENGQLSTKGEYLLTAYPTVIHNTLSKQPNKIAYIYEARHKGTWIGYFENGNTLSITTFDKYGLINGVYKRWHEKGMLEEEIEIKHGKYYGYKKEYSDGKLLHLSYYAGNTRYGEWKSWYSNGNLC